MSDEAEQLIADHVQAKDIRYPIVRAPGAMAKYGGRFYPSYFTVGPDGTILTVPEDRSPGNDVIERELQTVVLVPEMPADSRFDPLRKAWQKRDFRKIDDYLAKMLAQDGLDAEIRAEFAAQRAEFDLRVERTTARVDQLADGPDYWAATTRLDKIADEWDRTPIGDRAEELLKHFKKDAAIKKEVIASRTLAALFDKYDQNSIVQRRKLVAALQEFEKRYDGTHAATRARSRRTTLATR